MKRLAVKHTNMIPTGEEEIVKNKKKHNEEEESSHNSSDICYSEIPSPIISRGRQVPRKYQASPDMFKSDSDDNPTPPCSPPAGYNQAPIKSGHDSADTDRTEPSSPPAYFYQETPEKRLKMGKHLA